MLGSLSGRDGCWFAGHFLVDSRFQEGNLAVFLCSTAVKRLADGRYGGEKAEKAEKEYMKEVSK